jgi:hypothetical protein
MRLMLGDKSGPSLLVSVDDNYDPKKFEFTVINGGWDGVFTNGHITILGDPCGAWSDIGITEILTDNQDRLRCDFTVFDDYNTVFDNFDNPNYVAPLYKEVQRPACWDDDIPF